MSINSNRRALLTGLGAAAAGLAAGAVPAQAQGAVAPGRFTPARHKEDEWLDTLPGKHRVFIDASTSDGATEALLYAGNLFVANKSGYNLNDEDIVTVVCLRHYATIFAYNNVIWAKYGKVLAEAGKYSNPANPEPPTANPRRNIDSLAKRGVHYAVCDLATKRFATQLATATNAKSEDVYKELVANAVPNAHFMAAGVVATTRAQEYGYSLLVCG